MNQQTVSGVNGRIDNSQGKPGQFRQSTNVNGLENSLKPDAWRTRHALREESSPVDSEASEIDAKETRTGNELDTSGTVESHSKHTNMKANCSQAGFDPIRTRLRKIESELSAVLNALKSDANADASNQASESSANDELLKLNDAWEFRETEIMSRKVKLRSIRAKLAVLEGRQALAVIDAQRLLEQKQKRITGVRKAVQLLCTVNIVWPKNNRASEVFLTGSFDGWATQRKMEKSSSGVFSLNMKLYPGKSSSLLMVSGRLIPCAPLLTTMGL
ncbi:Protein PTST homolog 2, chloroplastic [Linum grandiflorum]